MSTTFSDLLRPVEEGGPEDATPGLLEAINDEGLSRLAREDQGAYNFTGSMDQVRAIRIMALGAQAQDPLLVPPDFHEKWRNQLRALGQVLQRVEEFSPTEDPTPNELSCRTEQTQGTGQGDPRARRMSRRATLMFIDLKEKCDGHHAGSRALHSAS